MLVYIIGRYTPHGFNVKEKTYKKIQDKYIKKANDIGKEIFLMGHEPVIPHNMWSRWEHDEKMSRIKHSEWIDMTIKIMFKCDAVFLMPGWETAPGCKKEVDMWIDCHGVKMLFEKLEDIKG